MKIAYLTAARMPARDANCVHSAKMCEAFAQEGHAVTMLARRNMAADTSIFDFFGIRPSFETCTFPPRGIRGTRTLFLLRAARHEVTARVRPDLIFGRDVLMVAAALSSRQPFIFDAHGIPAAGSLRSRLLGRLFRHSGFRGLICITHSLKGMYVERYPYLTPERVLVLPNGAEDMQRPHGAATVSPATTNRFQIGYVGRVYRGRGMEAVLAAARAMPESDFHIVGAARTDITWMTDTFPANVHFHGYVRHGLLPEHYARFDALVAPYDAAVYHAGGGDSSSYASPMKLFEYMSTARPIVASALPGVREVLVDGTTGLTVPPGDAAAFTHALLRLRDDAALRARLGEAARDQYTRQHSWRHRARAALTLLSHE